MEKISALKSEDCAGRRLKSQSGHELFHFEIFACSAFFTSRLSQHIWDSPWYTPANTARRGGTEVAGWTLDRKIRVRFPAYPHRVWALWWQGGKRRLRTPRCPCRGRLGTPKTPSCPWRGYSAAGQNLETGHLSRHYIAEISLNVTFNHKQQPANTLFI